MADSPHEADSELLLAAARENRDAVESVLRLQQQCREHMLKHKAILDEVRDLDSEKLCLREALAALCGEGSVELAAQGCGQDGSAEAEEGPAFEAEEDPPAIDHVPFPPGTQTLMLCNLPTRWSQDNLLALWPFDGTFDFLYTPWSQRQRRFSGQAFMNFRSPGAAEAFSRRWRGFVPQGSVRSRAIQIHPSRSQGLQSCVSAMGLTGLVLDRVRDHHMPAVFDLGYGRRLTSDEVRALVLSHAGR